MALSTDTSPTGPVNDPVIVLQGAPTRPPKAAPATAFPTGPVISFTPAAVAVRASDRF